MKCNNSRYRHVTTLTLYMNVFFDPQDKPIKIKVCLSVSRSLENPLDVPDL
jgi:hypothetical protein